MKKKINKIDTCFLSLFLILFFLGLYLFFSASLVDFSNTSRTFNGVFLNQFISALISLILIYPISRFKINKSNDRMKFISFSLIFVSLFFLFITLIPFFQPSGNFSAHRWLDLGFIFFQPLELFKLSLAIYFSYLLSLNLSHRINNKDFLVFFSIPSFLGIIFLFFQPDYDGIFFILILSFLNLFFSNLNLKKILISFLIFGILVVGISLSKDYVRDRVFNSLESRQVDYNITAIGSGGLWGRGINESYDKFFLQESNTDSIFSVIALEIGFFRTLLIIILFLSIVYRGFLIASRAKDYFSSLLVFNLMFIFFFQFFIHLISNLGILFFIGTPLPFFSKGGTYLLINTISFALIFAVSRNLKKI